MSALSEAEKSLSAVSSKYESKRQEIQASERELSELRFRHQLVPWTRELRRLESDILKQLQRRHRKAGRLRLEQLEVEQRVDELRRQAADDQHRDAQQPLRDLAAEIREVVRVLAAEEAVEELALRRRDYARVLYSYGPDVLDVFQKAVELLEQYARLTDRGQRIEQSGISALWRDPDFHALAQWALSGSGATDTGEQEIVEPAASEAVESEDSNHAEPLPEQSSGIAETEPAGEPEPATVAAAS